MNTLACQVVDASAYTAPTGKSPPLAFMTTERFRSRSGMLGSRRIVSTRADGKTDLLKSVHVLGGTVYLVWQHSINEDKIDIADLSSQQRRTLAKILKLARRKGSEEQSWNLDGEPIPAKSFYGLGVWVTLCDEPCDDYGCDLNMEDAAFPL